MSELSDPIGTMKRMVSSEVKAELLMLFHRNPGLMDTVEGVARRLGYEGHAVNADLNDLVEMGILRNKRVGRLNIYALDVKRDKEVQRAIAGNLRAMKAGKA